EVLKHQAYRSVGAFVANGGAGPETSVDKLAMTSAGQRLGEASLAVLGPFGGLIDDAEGLPWQHQYMYSRAASIYGGTSQIQKNIIAERVLGLPRSA
ncbi:MAG TPA: acyl-CoA dehydrogenase family protein, partial [Solirubrobacteraceae bacterium]